MAPAEAPATVVPRTVDGAEDLLGEPADVLHHVDLAGTWPRVAGDVGAEAPEGWPEAVASGRHLQPRLDAPIGELSLVLGYQAGRLEPVVRLLRCSPTVTVAAVGAFRLCRDPQYNRG